MVLKRGEMLLIPPFPTVPDQRGHNLILSVLHPIENMYSNNPRGFGISLGALLQMFTHNATVTS